MKKILFLLFALSQISFLFSEVLLLNDGSILKGKQIKMDEDTMTLLGEFGEVVIERNKIKKTYNSENDYNEDNKKNGESVIEKPVILKNEVIVLKNDERLIGTVTNSTDTVTTIKTILGDKTVNKSEIVKYYASESEYYEDKYKTQKTQNVISLKNEVILLNNGEKLIGTIIEQNSEFVVLRSSFGDTKVYKINVKKFYPNEEEYYKEKYGKTESIDNNSLYNNDVILLEDGNKVNGKIIKSDDLNITIKSYDNDIDIPRSTIKKIYVNEDEYKKDFVLPELFLIDLFGIKLESTHNTVVDLLRRKKIPFIERTDQLIIFYKNTIPVIKSSDKTVKTESITQYKTESVVFNFEKDILIGVQMILNEPITTLDKIFLMLSKQINIKYIDSKKLLAQWKNEKYIIELGSIEKADNIDDKKNNLYVKYYLIKNNKKIENTQAKGLEFSVGFGFSQYHTFFYDFHDGYDEDGTKFTNRIGFNPPLMSHNLSIPVSLLYFPSKIFGVGLEIDMGYRFNTFLVPFSSYLPVDFFHMFANKFNLVLRAKNLMYGPVFKIGASVCGVFPQNAFIAGEYLPNGSFRYTEPTLPNFGMGGVNFSLGIDIKCKDNYLYNMGFTYEFLGGKITYNGVDYTGLMHNFGIEFKFKFYKFFNIK